MAVIIGWLSSVVLLITLSVQVWTVWKDRPHAESARRLFWGQITASVGFCTYSALQRDPVFIVTNAAILVNAVVGAIVSTVRARKKKAAGATGQTAPDSGSTQSAG